MRPVTALIILDGFGCSEQTAHNAIAADGAKHSAALRAAYPHTTLGASGLDVGLPAGQMGNSEVGHLNIGAGRVVYQELTRISKAIGDGDFFENPAFLKAMENARAQGTSLHLMGLLSDGGVHSHATHLSALVRMARAHGLDKVFVHCFMDGRDVPPSSGKAYVEALEETLGALGCGKIATVMGRYYAMDRDNRYERVERAYAALVYGEGEAAESAAEAMQNSYARGDTDEFVQPTVILENGAPVGTIGPQDSVIFFNFRPDRARELTRSFIFPDFDGFPRKKGFFPLTYVSMTQYDKNFGDRLDVAFQPENLDNTLGAWLAQCGKTQLRIAETEKYAHVTFFFNGGVEAPN
ncbi:MAG: 2,3-bisphosphoglycerate-independent phosphoglycerate mutase, partial [Clostridia bacterium]|nr:2,3-bisphosphoglycerate-independent phosphoglycerate mutase [Clostridia bacterium]